MEPTPGSLNHQHYYTGQPTQNTSQSHQARSTSQRQHIYDQHQVRYAPSQKPQQQQQQPTQFYTEHQQNPHQPHLTQQQKQQLQQQRAASDNLSRGHAEMYSYPSHTRTLDPYDSHMRVAMPVPSQDPHSLNIGRQRPADGQIKMPVPEVPLQVQSQLMMQQRALQQHQQSQLQNEQGQLQQPSGRPRELSHKSPPGTLAATQLRHHSEHIHASNISPSGVNEKMPPQVPQKDKNLHISLAHDKQYQYYGHEPPASPSTLVSSSSSSSNSAQPSPPHGTSINGGLHTSGTYLNGISSNGTHLNGVNSNNHHPNGDSSPQFNAYNHNVDITAASKFPTDATVHNSIKAFPTSEPPSNALHQLTVNQRRSSRTDPSLSAGHRKFGSDSAAIISDLTVDQFETLRRQATTQPHDPRIQLELARKLFEASHHLANRYTDPSHPSTMEVDETQRELNREAWISQAVKITKKLAAKTQYPDALFLLGSIYSSGQYGVEMDNMKALECYYKAARLDHPESCYRIAVCEEFGVGTKGSIEKAVNWYKKAAMLGNVGSMYKLGMLNLLGSTQHPRDFATGLSWLERAADLADAKNPHAVYELALLHEHSHLSSYNDGDPIARSESRALELFYTAAKLGYAPSQTRIGRAFEFGELGCPVDANWSTSWYAKAAQQGDSDSELAMAGWYWTGAPNLKKNETEAFLWAERSARKGNPRAMYAVGYFSEVGIGVPCDLIRAKKWYMLAAEKKNPRAIQKLKELY